MKGFWEPLLSYLKLAGDVLQLKEDILKEDGRSQARKGGLTVSDASCKSFSKSDFKCQGSGQQAGPFALWPRQDDAVARSGLEETQPVSL